MASRGEGLTASLAAQGLDALSRAVGAVADERVDLRVGDAEVDAGGVVAGEALGVDLLGSATPAPDLGPGTDERRGRSRGYKGGLLLPTVRAVVGGAGLEQPLVSGPRGSGLRLDRPMQVPEPDEPEQAEEEPEQEEPGVGHRRVLVI